MKWSGGERERAVASAPGVAARTAGDYTGFLTVTLQATLASLRTQIAAHGPSAPMLAIQRDIVAELARRKEYANGE